MNVSFSIFHQQLSPYGKWLHNPSFGDVWVNNDAGFKPYYTDGHWEYTNYGWSWVSDYDGAGPHSIMEDGSMIRITAGCGYQDMNGLLLGQLELL